MEEPTESGRRVLRVYVEPVELELDADDSLLVTSLQSAIPGASGLYFKGECKSSIKFDGKKLLPPAGGWQQRKYFATLGSRSFDFPYGSYANASKQFERSVNAVQRMFGNTKIFNLPDPLDEELMAKRKSAVISTTPLPHKSTKSENMKMLFASLMQKQPSPPPLTVASEEQQNLSPMEQQFIDLARISTAKDTIIESQRNDLKEMAEEVETNQKSLKKNLEETAKLESRCAAQEEELNILRALSREQTYMCDKVNDLTKKNVDAEETMIKLKEEISRLKEQLNDASRQSSELSTKLSEQANALEDKANQLTDIEKELYHWRSLAEDREKEVMVHVAQAEELDELKKQKWNMEQEMNDALEKHSNLDRLYKEAVEENTILTSRVNELQTLKECADTKLNSLETDWRQKLTEEKVQWKSERDMLKSDLLASEKKLAELSGLVQQLTKEAGDNLQRAEQAVSSRDELKRTLEVMESKIQEAVLLERRETCNVRHDLEDAQRRVAELTSLIADFSSDALNSRRDVSDIL